jgi:hypothetical protein
MADVIYYSELLFPNGGPPQGAASPPGGPEEPPPNEPPPPDDQQPPASKTPVTNDGAQILPGSGAPLNFNHDVVIAPAAQTPPTPGNTDPKYGGRGTPRRRGT